ncbi:unnamed protein product, partial [Allacma fusca]
MARSALPTILFALFASTTAAIYFPINLPSTPANSGEKSVFKDLAVTLPDPTRPLLKLPIGSTTSQKHRLKRNRKDGPRIRKLWAALTP